MRFILFLLGIVLISGCATTLPETTSGIMRSDKKPREQAVELYHQAQKCWERDCGLFGDGVYIETRIDLRGILIQAKRFCSDISVKGYFAEIIVNPHEEGSSVQVREGGYYNPVSEVSIIPEVRQWVSGSLDCITNKDD